MMIGHHLLQSTRYPVATYPRAVQGLLLFVFPFGAFHYLPGAVLFGKGAPLVALGAAPLAALVAIWLAHRAWALGLRRYESTGS
jgi:ABC-2 type transport system permease protein